LIQLLKIFKSLAIEFNASLTINGYPHDLEKQSEAQRSHYKLLIPYKKETLSLEYMVGAQHTASMSIIVEEITEKCAFEVTTRSHFMSLFSGKANKVQVKSENLDLKRMIESNEHFLEMKRLIQNSRFEPLIFGKYTRDGYLMKTEYHLVFPKRTQEIHSLIHFHQALIDFVE
jgi:hypothetical protein